MLASMPGDIQNAGRRPTIAKPTTERACRKRKVRRSGPSDSQYGR
jgi:hypothetical protein